MVTMFIHSFFFNPISAVLFAFSMNAVVIFYHFYFAKIPTTLTEKKLPFVSIFTAALNALYAQRCANSEVPRLLDSLASSMRAGLNAEAALRHVKSDFIWKSYCSEILHKINSRFDSGANVSHAILETIETLPKHPVFIRLKNAFISLATMQRSGGDTVQMLTDAAKSCRKAIALRRKAQVLSAQMKLQAIVIASSPAVVAFILAVVSPASLEVFTRDSMGIAIAITMIILNILGIFYLIRISSSWSR